MYKGYAYNNFFGWLFYCLSLKNVKKYIIINWRDNTSFNTVKEYTNQIRTI